MISIRKRDKGTAVIVLQHLLNVMLFPGGKLATDGDFGPLTYAAVVEYQKRRGLKPDGVVGRRTWAALGMTGEHAPLLSSPMLVRWLVLAEAEMGVKEIFEKGEHNKRIVEYHSTTTLKATDDETPWCSSFVNWVMRQSGIKGTNSAAAKSWVKWGKALKKPRKGAIAIIKKKSKSPDAATGSYSGYHVAFYLGSSDKSITLLGGNQFNQVKKSTYSRSRWQIVDYRWPVSEA